MTRLLLVRHGHVEGIEPARFRGRTELALTELGIAQARATAQHIARHWRPGRVYTSPLGRCVETGRQIAEACGVGASMMAELNDLDYGEWRGLSHAQVRERWPDAYRLWEQTPERVQIPGGEPLQSLAARAQHALQFLRQSHATDTVVLVAHEAVNRVLLLLVLDLPLSAYRRLTQSPCAVNELLLAADGAGERSVVIRINETAHLSGLPVERGG